MQDRDETAGTGEGNLQEDTEEGQFSFERDNTEKSLNSGENEKSEEDE
jgi:hypothetical protein